MSESELPDVSATDVEENTSGSGKPLSGTDFAQAREFYELGTLGLSDLAEKFGVSRQALSKRFKNNGVVKGSRAHELAKAVSTGVAAATQQAAQDAVERFSDKRADWIEETRVAGYKALKQAEMLARKQVADAHRAGAAMATIDDNLKAVHRFHRILKENYTTRLQLLRADEHVNEEDLPQLSLVDLTQEDILQHHKNIDAVDEDADVDALLDIVGAGDLDLDLT